MYEGSGWWRGEPEIINGAIRLKKNTHINFYQFFTGVTEEADPIMPHRALIRVQTVKDAVDFVGKYGLLGLWKCKPYAFSEVNLKINFIIDEDRRGEMDFYFQWQEPISLFMLAVREFRETAEALMLSEPATDDFKATRREALNSLDGWISECHPATTAGFTDFTNFTEFKARPIWHCPSLLHACYLGLWLDLTEGRKLRRCADKYCERLFYADRPNKRFCSEECRNRANRRAHYHRQKDKALSSCITDL
ncbi:CGNR zinc finger domain-containing protein [Thermoanaerobacter uzonensis]|uniref:CGNR zinc finger domain-containing protein n=1 Tax=Thermoanaerobacter uzonensis TaxID=447593 RepID=UPI003D768B5F